MSEVCNRKICLEDDKSESSFDMESFHSAESYGKSGFFEGRRQLFNNFFKETYFGSTDRTILMLIRAKQQKVEKYEPIK